MDHDSHKRLSLSPPMAPYNKNRTYSNTLNDSVYENGKMYSDWEHRRSADNENNQQIEYKDANRRLYSSSYEVERPLQQQQRQQHNNYGRSHPDQFLPRRSSASASLSTNNKITTAQQQRVDPPRLHHHRRTASEFLERRRPEEVPYRTSYSPPLNINNANTNRYKCNQCLKTFSRPSSLRIHILSHTGEKPHVCPQPGCGRRFSVQSNMRRHLKVHYCNSQQQPQQQQQQQQHQQQQQRQQQQHINYMGRLH